MLDESGESQAWAFVKTTQVAARTRVVSHPHATQLKLGEWSHYPSKAFDFAPGRSSPETRMACGCERCSVEWL